MNGKNEKIAKLRAQLAAAERQHKTEQRKLDTRQKVVMGAAVMAEAKLNPEFRKFLSEILQRQVTRAIDSEAVSSWLSTT